MQAFIRSNCDCSSMYGMSAIDQVGPWHQAPSPVPPAMPKFAGVTQLGSPGGYEPYVDSCCAIAKPI